MASIGEFLEAFGFENMLLIATFLISFVIINFSLKKFLKEEGGRPNRTVSGIIAFALSMLIVYGVYAMEFDLGGLLFDLGLEGDMLETIIVFVILGAIIWLFWKLKSRLLLILGILLVAVSFTDYVYESGVIFFTGLVLLALWLLIKIITRDKKPRYDYGPPPSSRIEDGLKDSEKRYMRERIRREEAEIIATEERERRRLAELRSKTKKRSIHDLKQKYVAYRFEYNKNIPKKEGESSENYQIRKARRQIRIKQIMEMIVKKIKEKGGSI